MRTLTRRELARYNGKDGAPAYFACEGRVYDASRSLLWQSLPWPVCRAGRSWWQVH